MGRRFRPTLYHFAVLALILLGFLNFFACSPVQFGNGPVTSCTVASPCQVGPYTMEATQQITFTTTNKVDVLVVVDNSGSYHTEDQYLGDPLNGFVNNLTAAGLDWTIGVTTTDVCTQSDQNDIQCGPGDVGAQGGIVGPSGSNPPTGNQYIITPGSGAANLFNLTVQRNDSGSGDERAIYAANLAIDQANTVNAGFFRDNSNLAVVIISDEDERSVGGQDPQDPQYAPLSLYDEPQTLVNKVATVWGGTKSLLVDSIIINPNDNNLYPDPNWNKAPGGPYPQNNTCYNVMNHMGPPYDFASYWGNVYDYLTAFTNGVVGSICSMTNGSFATMLSNITGDIGQMPLTNTITLNYVPIAQPTVTFNPTQNAVPWTWQAGSNQVKFTTRPANGTVVSFTYDFSG